MSTTTIEQAVKIALTHHRMGRMSEAEAIYRQILDVQPRHPDALYLLGVIAGQTGQRQAALDLISRAIAANDNDASYHSYLGEMYQQLGRLDEAITSYECALALKPDFAEVHNNLGSALANQGRLDEAVTSFRQALAIRPDYPDAFYNLGTALSDNRQWKEATSCFKRVLALRPDFAEAHNNLGSALTRQGRLDEAISACERALALKPDFAEAYNNLGNAYKDQGRVNEAIVSYERALALRPDFAEVFNNLGNAFKDQGQLDEALVHLRQAVVLAPDQPSIHSNFLYTLYFHPSSDARTILTEHRQWARQHGGYRRQFIRSYSNDPDPDRPLKIGYVSPNLREHPVGRFLLPLLQNHDHAQFQVVCYADVIQPDTVTKRLQLSADYWHLTMEMSEERVTEQIREDGVDVLVDMSLHMADNRLTVFARKPAPVQVTYLAYAGTSGLNAMDYRLTDSYLDPPGASDDCYVETSIRLPQTYWCYQAPEQAPALMPQPALTLGYITFGCLNNFSKVNERVLMVWARILRAAPGARLRLHAMEGSHRNRTLETLAREGIATERTTFISHTPPADYFANHGQTDIALDSFPYAGGTTTCDALWMGVPVVSLAGQTAVSRGGLSILSNIGLPELVAQTEDEYVRIAVDLAHDLPRLARLRATMRERMQASPLMDAPRFARNIEDAYRTLWRKWCAGQK